MINIAKFRPALQVSCTICAAVLFVPATVLAQSESVRVLEEIVVTAQKRAESLQDVPVAVTAFNEEFFFNVKTTSIADILPYTPGLSGHVAGGTDPVFAIRGISTNAFGNGSEPSIGVFMDDAYVGRNVLASSAFFDLERIEVARGPQGTLFGRNAAAGAINVITKAPALGETTLHVGLGIGNEEQKKADIQANIAVSDRFAIRISGLYDSYGGIQTNLFDGSDVNDKNMKGARVGIRYDFSDRVDAILRLQATDYDALGYSGPSVGLGEVDEDYPDEFTNNIDPNDEKVRTNGANLRISWDMNDSMSLTSITDYRDWEMDFAQDVDGVGFWTVNYFQDAQDAQTYSQEFRLDGESGNLRWFVGASYFREDIGGPQRLDVDLCTLADFGFITEADLDPDGDPDVFLDCAAITAIDPEVASALVSDNVEDLGKYSSFAVYTDLVYDFSEKWSLTAGARWTRDKKDFSAWAYADLGLLGSDTGGIPYSDVETWTDFSPRLVVDYRASNDVMVYASVAKGYKAGGFNTSVDTQAEPPQVQSFDPETNVTYEIGMKSKLLDDTLRLNGALFHMDYKDLQVETLIGALPFVNNASDATVRGIELEATWITPLEGLTLTVNGAYLDQEYTNGEITLTGVDGEPFTEVLDGRKLNAAPEKQLSFMALYETGLGDLGTLSLFGAYNYQSDMFYDISNADYLKEDPYSVLNGRIRFTPASEKWDVSLVGENLTDKDYAVRRQDPLGFGTAQVIRGTPLFYRLEVNFYF